MTELTEFPETGRWQEFTIRRLNKDKDMSETEERYPVYCGDGFFKVDHASSGSKEFAWAGGFGPLPAGMPFLHPAELERSIRFWEVNPMPAGLHIDSDGSKWPDFLGHGGGSPSFFVSEYVIQTLRAIGAPIKRLTEMPVATIDSKRLRKITPPKYFVVETQPGIELDYVASGISVDSNGKVIFPIPRGTIFKFRPESWNRTDLFAYSNFGFGPSLNWFCTDKLKLCASQAKWTNVEFKPFGGRLRKAK